MDSLESAAVIGGLAGGAALIIAHFVTRELGELPVLWRYVIGVAGIGLGWGVACWIGAPDLLGVTLLPLATVTAICGACVKLAHAWHPFSARVRAVAASPVDDHLGGDQA